MSQCTVAIKVMDWQRLSSSPHSIMEAHSGPLDQFLTLKYNLSQGTVVGWGQELRGRNNIYSMFLDERLNLI